METDFHLMSCCSSMLLNTRDKDQFDETHKSHSLQERVIGQDHHVHAHPHDHIARALPKGAVADRPGGEGWVQGKAGPVCDSTTFEVTGDRTVDKVSRRFSVLLEKMLKSN